MLRLTCCGWEREAVPERRGGEWGLAAVWRGTPSGRLPVSLQCAWVWRGSPLGGMHRATWRLCLASLLGTTPSVTYLLAGPQGAFPSVARPTGGHQSPPSDGAAGRRRLVLRGLCRAAPARQHTPCPGGVASAVSSAPCPAARSPLPPSAVHPGDHVNGGSFQGPRWLGRGGSRGRTRYKFQKLARL